MPKFMNDNTLQKLEEGLWKPNNKRVKKTVNFNNSIELAFFNNNLSIFKYYIYDSINLILVNQNNNKFQFDENNIYFKYQYDIENQYNIDDDLSMIKYI